MTLDFYYMMGSPPCSLVSLVFAAVGIESKVKAHCVDMMANEHLSPEFLKLNPQHTTPTIVDDGFVLSESRTIAKYLASKYGSELYPMDLKTRALVDQKMDFDLGTLYSRFGDYYYKPFFGGVATQKSLDNLKEALGFLNQFLEGTKYAAGANLTLADYSLAVTISMIKAADISIADYPNILRWYAIVKSTIPKYEEINGKYVEEFKEFFDMLKKQQN